MGGPGSGPQKGRGSKTIFGTRRAKVSKPRHTSIFKSNKKKAYVPLMFRKKK